MNLCFTKYLSGPARGIGYSDILAILFELCHICTVITVAIQDLASSDVAGAGRSGVTNIQLKTLEVSILERFEALGIYCSVKASSKFRYNGI